VAGEEARALGAEHREAEAEAAAGSSHRGGSREVELTRVRLLDAAGQERYLYDAGEACTIRLAWRAPRPVEDPVFGIGIFRKDGVCCYGTNTAIDGLHLGKLAGEGEVGMAIHRLDLVEGEYLLDVAVHAGAATYDYHSRVRSLLSASRHRRRAAGARWTRVWRPAVSDRASQPGAVDVAQLMENQGQVRQRRAAGFYSEEEVGGSPR
jgi:hypothetical protein